MKFDELKARGTQGMDARCTIKYSRKRDDAPTGQIDIAVPAFDDKSHIIWRAA